MTKFIPEHLKDIETEVRKEVDITDCVDLTDETYREKKDLIRDILGRFDYTPDEINEFVNDIDIGIPIRKINNALSMFVKGERNINTECKYMFPIYIHPLRTEKKKELIEQILIGGMVDDYLTDIIVNNINYDLDLKFIRSNIFKYFRSRQLLSDEKKYILPILIEEDIEYIFPILSRPMIPEMKVKLRKEPKELIRATDIIDRKKKEGVKKDKMAVSEEAEVDALQYPARVKKTEEEVVRILSPTEAQAEVYARRLKGEDIFCVFCEKIITSEEVMGFWYNVHPAHMKCIHEQLNIKRSEKGLPAIEYEKL